MDLGECQMTFYELFPNLTAATVLVVLSRSTAQPPELFLHRLCTTRPHPAYTVPSVPEGVLIQHLTNSYRCPFIPESSSNDIRPISEERPHFRL